MQKIINSNTAKYQPMLTDNLVLDDKPTVNSFNGITSDGVARAIAGASGEVPAVTESDNGKILTAIYDEGGAAVEWADAPSGGDVTTADGYFRLGGSKPVKVQYTGSLEQIVTPESLDVDDHTKYRNNAGASSNQICVWFDNTDGLKDLGADYTATLKMKAASLLAGFPAGVIVYNTTPVFYCNDSTWDAPAGPYMTGQLTVTDNDIKEQTITVSGANQAGATSGYGAYIGFIININNAIDPATQGYYDLTDPLDTLIADIEAGNVFELVWPNVTSGTDMLTKITAIPDNTHQDNKFLKTVQTGQSTWEIQWATINQVPSYSSIQAGKVLTVNQYGSAVNWADAPTELPTVTGNAGKVLAVNSGATGVEWVAPADYTMVYNTAPAGGSADGTPWQAVQAGKRIGVVVPYSAFSGSLAAGSLYTSGKIYMPLASVVDRSSGEYRWNFYLYDGSNKWSLALTCDEDEWSWGTPSVTPG